MQVFSEGKWESYQRYAVSFQVTVPVHRQIINIGQLSLIRAIKMAAQIEKIRELSSVCHGMPQNKKIQLFLWKIVIRSQEAHLLNLPDHQWWKIWKWKKRCPNKHQILLKITWKWDDVPIRWVQQKIILHKKIAWRGEINGSFQVGSHTLVGLNSEFTAMVKDWWADWPSRHKDVERRSNKNNIRELIFTDPHWRTKDVVRET